MVCVRNRQWHTSARSCSCCSPVVPARRSTRVWTVESPTLPSMFLSTFAWSTFAWTLPPMRMRSTHAPIAVRSACPTRTARLGWVSPPFPRDDPAAAVGRCAANILILEARRERAGKSASKPPTVSSPRVAAQTANLFATRPKTACSTMFVSMVCASRPSRYTSAPRASIRPRRKRFSTSFSQSRIAS